ncbi:hypothetical protein QG37_01456 [Candidozyma auris]|nr:hypothetical protein QG37_01456 [[Candida] auris]
MNFQNQDSKLSQILQKCSEHLLAHPSRVSCWEQLIYEIRLATSDERTDFNRARHETLQLIARVFFRHNPFLSKYWRWHAIDEFHHARSIEAKSIFERGLSFSSHDITLWLAYLSYRLTTTNVNVGDLLHLFEEARHAIGTNYYASEFYKLYFSFLEAYTPEINNHEQKKALLGSQITLCPLYNHASLQERLFESGKLSSSSVSETSKVGHLLSAYVYYFERELLFFEGLNLSRQIISLWSRYIDSMKAWLPRFAIFQLYERALISTNFEDTIVISYSNFALERGLFNKARNVLKKGLLCNDDMARTRILKKILMLELYEGNVLRVRDYLAQLICCNAEYSMALKGFVSKIESLL